MGQAYALIVFVAVLPARAAPPSSSLPLDPVADVPLPGGATRFDYQWVDVERRRLYIAHLGDSALVVFDLDGQRVQAVVPGLASVHGVVAAPGAHLILATATADKTLALIDDETFKVTACVRAGDYPNGLAYDPVSGKAWVSNNVGPGIAVVDVGSAEARPSIDVGGGAGNTQYDEKTGHVLAAVHGRGELADIDPGAAKVAGRIVLRDVTSCHGLAVASGLRLAFAACRGSGPTLVVVDLETRRQAAAVPLPAEVDVLAFDPGPRRLYAAAESGIVAVFAIGPDLPVRELGRGLVAPHAHSVAVDPKTHRVYFPLENVHGRPVLRVMAPR